MTFRTKEKFEFAIFTRREGDKPQNKIIDTAITLLRPASSSEKLIVIDPGHGGIDPGATRNGLYEKALNLDIALRLNALLKKKNIKTYMIRDNDVYVGLYERAEIANQLNGQLFLSIHCNSSDIPTARGTEVFYYQNVNINGFNGKTFASIIQNKLVGALKTLSRGIEARNLVVIRETKMSAVLAEIAFMSNSTEASNLGSADFRQRAAQALCDAIVETLEKTN